MEVDYEKQLREMIEETDRLTEEGWPPALAKALEDEFAYMVRLRSGEVISFTYAQRLNDKFVRIEGIEAIAGLDFDPTTAEKIESTSTVDVPFLPRGMDVRVSDIVWAADAPWGS